MQAVPVNRYTPRVEVRSQEMQPISDLNFSPRASGSREVPTSSRYTRSGSITANYYGDESVNMGAPNSLNRQNSFTQSMNVSHKKSRQSRRLPYWVWYVLAKSLGIKLSETDRPVFGAVMHVLTIMFALGFGVTFTWHKIYDIVSEYTKETVLKGAVAILMTLYWCCLGVYANQLASKLFRNPKFLDSVRLHTKTIFKISAAGIMVFLGITVIILHCVDTVETFYPKYCQKVRISPLVCRVMYIMKVGCVCMSLLWNLLVGIVLLSVCRTHTIGIRRFIRELEIDGKLYELHLRRQNRRVNTEEHFQHEDLWNQPLDANRDDLWDNLTVEEILPDDSVDNNHPTGLTARSCPSSPVMLRPPRHLPGAVGVSFSLPRHISMDGEPSTTESLRNRQTHRRTSRDGDDRHDVEDVRQLRDYQLNTTTGAPGAGGGGGSRGGARRNPFDMAENLLGDSAITDHFTSDEPVYEGTNNVLLLEENYYEQEGTSVAGESQKGPRDNNNGANKRRNSEASSDLEGGNQGEGRHQGDGDVQNGAAHNNKDVNVWRFLSVDDIYLSFWKISCRLRFTSIALQRWLLGFLMYIILWSFTYIIYWVKHEASMMDIALFLIPILIMPIVCSAYGEVNYEGRRMLTCICPTSERTEMLQTLFMQPLELNAFGFAISYQVIGGALGALAIAFCTRLILDEISSS